ncbi:MAG: TonB-dependent receptor [Bacteroidales bacterium]|nr:TonB-dependent receptor [Bacteroidales bacterium]
MRCLSIEVILLLVVLFCTGSMIYASPDMLETNNITNNKSIFSEPGQQHPDTLARLSLFENTVLLQEFVVEAYNQQRKLVSTPGSLSLIGPGQLLMQPGPGLITALNNASGLFAHTGTFNTTRITIRGIGARIPYATGRIRAYFDDIPLTNGSGTSIIEYVDPALIQYAEVIKSPATSAYGAGLGGTVLLRSKPVEEYTSLIGNHIHTGAFGMINNTLSVEAATKDLKGRLVHSIGSFDGYRENNAHNRHMIGATGHMKLKNDSQLSAIFLLHRMKAFIPSSIDSTTYENSPESAAANWLKTKGYEDGTRGLAGLSLRKNLKRNWNLSAGLYTSFSKENELRPFDMFDEDRMLGGLKLKSTKIVQMPNVDYRFAAGTEIFVEKVQFSNKQNTDGAGTAGNPISTNEELIRSANFFLQGDIDFKKANVSFGINFHDSDIYFENNSFVSNTVISGTYNNRFIVSPRIGTNLKLVKSHHVFLSLSHGFSPPALSETLNPDGKINPDIKPEKSLNYEAGLRGSLWKRRGWYDITFFVMDVTNLLVAERVGEDAWVGRNAGASLHKGIEAEVLYSFIGSNHQPKSFFNALDLKLSATLNNFRFTDFNDLGNDYSGKLIPGIPENIFSATLNFQIIMGTYASLNYRFVDRMAMNDANTKFTKSYQLADLMLGWKLSRAKVNVDFYLNLQNIFNQKYASMILVNAPSFGSQNARYYYPGMPFHVNGGVRFWWSYRQ